MSVKDTPFNMIITRMTGCAKTYYLLYFIEKNYKNHFDYIIISPTFSWNKTYENWKYINDPDIIIIECQQDYIDNMLRFASKIYRGTNSLIILDDCACSSDVKKRVSELIKLGFGARHYSLSTIVITQQLTSISKSYRENISKLSTFYNPNRNDMKIIIDDYMNGVSKEDIYKIINTLKNSKSSCKMRVLVQTGTSAAKCL